MSAADAQLPLLYTLSSYVICSRRHCFVGQDFSTHRGHRPRASFKSSRYSMHVVFTLIKTSLHELVWS